MKKLLPLLFFAFIGILTAGAQGSVTVHQSSDIDALVNGRKSAGKTKEQKKAEQKAAKRAAKDAQKRGETPHIVQENATSKLRLPSNAPSIQQIPQVNPVPNPSAMPKVQRTKIVRRLVRRPRVPDPYEIDDTRLVTKRLMHTIKKVRGFRVQVYSGGNTRVAHQEADRAGQKAKSLFPDEPVYVHFYTPRWMCLVGNFTNYKQAVRVMRRMRKEGYPNANVIRTMISVKTTKVVSEQVIE